MNCQHHPFAIWSWVIPFPVPAAPHATSHHLCPTRLCRSHADLSFPRTPGESPRQVLLHWRLGAPAENLLLLVWASVVSFPFVVTVQMSPLREIFLEN